MAKREIKLIRRRIAGSYVSSVISISLVLLLVGMASLLLVNSQQISDYFKEHMKVSVLMNPDVSEEQAQEFLGTLEALPYVRGTEFISRERGKEEMARMLGEDFLDIFETSPIPVSIDVQLGADYVSDDSLQVISSRLGASPLVDEVVYQKSLVDALNTNLSRISLVIGVLVVLLLFISFVLINNTVRLSVYERRFNIHTMKMVGATKGFIRGPFLVRSAFLGIFSAILAIILLIALLYFVRSEFSQLFDVFTLRTLLEVMGIVLVSGVVICVVSTYFVVGRLVSLSKDELYF